MTSTALASREKILTCALLAFDLTKPSWICGTVVPSSAATFPRRRSGKRARIRPSSRCTVSSTYSDSRRGRSSLTCARLVVPGHHGGVDDVGELFERLPVGWSVVEHDGRRYGVTRAVAASGRSERLLAEAMDGSDLVSANLYRLAAQDVLRPCEMPAQKVLDFLRDQQPAVTCSKPGD
jgi:hypothetical protein